MASSKNATFIVTPVFDKHYASFEVVCFSNFLSICIDQYFGKKRPLQKKHKVEQRHILGPHHGLISTYDLEILWLISSTST